MLSLLPKFKIVRGEKPKLDFESVWTINDRIEAPAPYPELKIEPEGTINLGAIDPGSHAPYDSIEAALPKLRSLSERLDELQRLMYAERKHSLLIVLQGLDASGKDGAIRHLLGAINPAGCRLVSFKRPKPEELAHDFLWRVHPHLPAKGDVTIFNRSHYEDVLVVRVHRLASVDSWCRRFEMINEFERMAAAENNTTILKFFLHISKKEQLVRFKQRLDDPTRQWKISDADYRERTYWGEYTEAFEDMLRRTSTRNAPWYVIPSNRKWFRDLAITEILVHTLESLNMKWPTPMVDIDEVRRRYHLAETEEDEI